MKGWKTTSSTTPHTAMMFQGTTVNREFMLMVEEAGATADNAKQNLESSGNGVQTMESSVRGVQFRTMESSGYGVKNLEGSDCGIEDTDYQFNNVMNDILDENDPLFLL